MTNDLNGQRTTGGLARLAEWCYDRRRIVLGGWILVVLTVIALSGTVGSAFMDNFNSGRSPSQRAQNLLAQRFPAQAGDTAYVAVHTSGQVTDPANAVTIGRMVSALRPLPDVSGVRSPLSPGAQRQVSADGRTAFAIVQFDKTTATSRTRTPSKLIGVARSFAHPGFEVALGRRPHFVSSVSDTWIE